MYQKPLAIADSGQLTDKEKNWSVQFAFLTVGRPKLETSWAIGEYSFVPDHRQPWDCSPTGLAEKTFVPAITYIHGGQPTPMLITASMLKIVRSFILLEEAMKRWKLALSWV